MECDVNLFAQMYKAVYRDLYRFALCMMKNVHDAEDSVSDAVISAYENIGKLREPEAFKNWIFTILANICKKKLLKMAREQNASIRNANGHDGGDGAAEGPEVCPDYGLSLDIRQAFSILSQEEQTIIGLSVFGGYDSKEIGGMLELNPNTVRSKRKRALEKMECVLK